MIHYQCYKTIQINQGMEGIKHKQTEKTAMTTRQPERRKAKICPDATGKARVLASLTAEVQNV